MSSPLVSVVIPTANRPRLLRRAVDSALACAPGGDVEVIVVPNGPDASWRDALAPLAQHPRLRCEPLAPAGANPARNHGLALARGTYVRFLDDDDVLYGEAAARQVDALERSGADICSGALEVVTEGRPGGVTVRQPETGDFVAAMLSPLRVTNPPAHAFRRAALPPAPWSPDVAVRQDIDFMITVALSRELAWITATEATGAWVQHRAGRVSQPYTRNADHVLMLRWLDAAERALAAQNRLNPARRRALAEALADSAHKAFPFAPAFWSAVLRRARTVDPAARPRVRVLGVDPFALAPALAVEWALLPARWLSIGVRRLRAALGLGPWARGI